MGLKHYDKAFKERAVKLSIQRGIYTLRQQRKSQNETLVRDCFENFEQLYGSVRISGELAAQNTPLSRTTVAK